MSSDALETLHEVHIQQRLSLPTQCELYFRLGRAELPKAFALGEPLKVNLEEGAGAIFEGEITAIEYSFSSGDEQEVYVRGYDLLHRLRSRQDVRAYSQSNAVNLAVELCKWAGIKQVKTEDVHPAAWPLVLQTRQDDLSFLGYRTALEGLYFSLHQGVLYLFTLAGIKSIQPVRLELDTDFIEAHLELNSNTAFARVLTKGWNPQNSEPVQANATSPRRSQHPSIPKALTDRSLLNRTLTDAEQARALAQAELDRIEAKKVTFWGKVFGNTALRPGSILQVAGQKPVAGEYVLTGVTHLLDSESGYTCEITTQAPEDLRQDQADVFTLGKVADNRDPEKYGRVRVGLPAYDDITLGWMPVVYPGAGHGKGFYSLPKIGDVVLVLLLESDPAEGVVLGGIRGHVGALHSEIVGSESTWITPAGQVIRMDETGDVIRLENRRGAYIELRGGEIVIAGSAVDFKKIGL